MQGVGLATRSVYIRSPRMQAGRCDPSRMQHDHSLPLTSPPVPSDDSQPAPARPHPPLLSAMLDIVRDSTFGHIVRFGSGNRFFKYAEEREGFQVPDHYILAPKKAPLADSSECSTVVDRRTTPNSDFSTESPPQSLQAKLDGAATPQELEDPFIVDWYGPDDPENPQ